MNKDNFDFSIPVVGKDQAFYKVVNGVFTNKKELFEKILTDALLNKEVLIKGGSYYKCAKFIKKYHTQFTFTKRTYSFVTCCNAYPKVCGGQCCSHLNYNECGCYKFPRGAEHVRNCYDDCCQIKKITSKRYFYLQWKLKTLASVDGSAHGTLV